MKRILALAATWIGMGVVVGQLGDGTWAGMLIPSAVAISAGYLFGMTRCLGHERCSRCI